MSTTGAQSLPHRPAPGVHPTTGGVEACVAAPHANQVWLCTFDDDGEHRVELPAAGDGWWAGFVAGLGPGTRYGFRVDGPWEPARGHRHNLAQLLLDPYARGVEGEVDYRPEVYGHFVDEHGERDLAARSEADSAPFVPRSVVIDPSFGWGDDAPPAPARDERVIYEVHVREMTMRLPEVPEHLRGTYAGMAHPATVEHLRRLGVTSIELLPVHAFADEEHLHALGLSNHWGYNTIGFFAPHAYYASSEDPNDVLGEFKGMVKLLHAAGIEVLLDVVYNHTAEQSTGGVTLGWRGLAASTYYRLDEQGHDVDVTGCGNSLDLNNPITLAMVLDSLRYWVTECHVDGFRYDLAFALGPQQRLVSRARLEHEGQFAAQPGRWQPFTSVQHITTEPPGFVWSAAISMTPLPVGVRVRDSYLSGVGASRVAIAGVFSLGDQEGTAEVAASALWRYLAEAVWLPTALLPSERLRWTAIDDRTARATLRDHGATAVADFHFGDGGEVVRVSGMRYRSVEGGLVLTATEGVIGSYERIDGMMIPTEGELAWLLPEGRHAYWRGTLVGTRYQY